MLYSLSPLPFSICKLVGTRQETSKCRLKDTLLQDHTNKGLQSLQEYAIIVDIIAFMNNILNKLSNAEFAVLFVKHIPYF